MFVRLMVVFIKVQDSC